MNIGIIGVGRWGRQLLRVFDDIANVKRCANKNDTDWVRENYPRINVGLNYMDILNDKTIEAVVISTPIKELFTIASESLKTGKHVFLEKPMVQNAEEAKKLVELASDKILFVGYVYLYHQIYQIIKKITSNDEPVRINTTWKKFGTFDSDIFLNLVSHDLSIVTGLFESRLKNIKLTQKESVISKTDVVTLDLDFDNGGKATIDINRTHPIKSKEIKIITKSGRVLYWIDDKLFELNKQKSCFELKQKSNKESLRTECYEFLEAIKKNKRPISDGEFGLQILKIISKLNKIS